MEITTAWSNYVKKMAQIDEAATNKILKYIGDGVIDFTNKNDLALLIDYSYGISTKYGEASAALACEMYDAIALASGINLDPAIPADVAEYSDVAKAINGTAKTLNPEIMAGAIGRLVKMAGQDTTLKNAIRDQAEFAWVTSGDTCAFCIAIASRGWQVASPSVLKGDHADHIHGNCDCCFAVRFDSNTKYKGYDPDALLEEYYDADTSSQGFDPNRPKGQQYQSLSKARINGMRREYYAEHKDKINAQKRIAYAARKERKAALNRLNEHS